MNTQISRRGIPDADPESEAGAVTGATDAPYVAAAASARWGIVLGAVVAFAATITVAVLALVVIVVLFPTSGHPASTAPGGDTTAPSVTAPSCYPFGPCAPGSADCAWPAPGGVACGSSPSEQR